MNEQVDVLGVSGTPELNSQLTPDQQSILEGVTVPTADNPAPLLWKLQNQHDGSASRLGRTVSMHFPAGSLPEVDDSCTVAIEPFYNNLADMRETGHWLVEALGGTRQNPVPVLSVMLSVNRNGAAPAGYEFKFSKKGAPATPEEVALAVPMIAGIDQQYRLQAQASSVPQRHRPRWRR